MSSSNGTINWPVKRAEIVNLLNQAEQQVTYWGSRRLQLQGQLQLLDELAPREVPTKEPETKEPE